MPESTWPKTPDLSERFFLDLLQMCGGWSINAIDLLSVMYAESACKASIQNVSSDASGLIQFMPQTLVGLGYLQGPAEFRKLTAAQQLPYVRRYFAPWVRKGLWSKSRVYQVVFMPGTLDTVREPDDILVQKGKIRGWAYAQNAQLDRNGDNIISLGELGLAIDHLCRGRRWDEIVRRVTGIDSIPKTITPPVGTLKTTQGVQAALQILGYYDGEIDGIPGKLTTKGITEFQADHGIDPIGIPGPKTRAELEKQLALAKHVIEG